MPLCAYRNPGRWRAVVHRDEIRHSTAGCLLSVVLLAPLFVRSYGVPTVAAAALLYAGVVVPTLAGYYSLVGLLARGCRVLGGCHGAPHCVRSSLQQGLVSPLLTFTRNLTSHLAAIVLGLLYLVTTVVLYPLYYLSELPSASLRLVTSPLHFGWSIRSFSTFQELHRAYVQSTSLAVTINQLVFFLLLEYLLTSQVRVLALQHLLGYSVLVYIHDSYLGSRRTSATSTTSPHYLAGTAWFMAARLGKAAVLSAMMSVTSYHYLDGNIAFTVVTMAYFALTQHSWTGDEVLVQWLKSFHFSAMEEDEEFWIPAFFNMIPILLSLFVIFSTVRTSFWTVLLTSHGDYSQLALQFLFIVPKLVAEFYKSLSFGTLLHIINTISKAFHTEARPKNNRSFLSHSTPTQSHSQRVVSSQTPRLPKIHTASITTETPPKDSEFGLSGPSLLLLVTTLAVYATAVVPLCVIRRHYDRHLRDHGGLLLRFRTASGADCARQGTCAVCLEELTCGRVTLCGHVYHSQCLRSLLSTHNTRCPLCKRTL